MLVLFLLIVLTSGPDLASVLAFVPAFAFLILLLSLSLLLLWVLFYFCFCICSYTLAFALVQIVFLFQIVLVILKFRLSIAFPVSDLLLVPFLYAAIIGRLPWEGAPFGVDFLILLFLNLFLIN